MKTLETTDRHPRRIARRLGAAARGLGLGLVLILGTGNVSAQCVMCGIAAEAANPEQASRTLATAILVLLLPTLGVLGGVGALLWKYRGDRAA